MNDESTVRFILQYLTVTPGSMDNIPHAFSAIPLVRVFLSLDVRNIPPKPTINRELYHFHDLSQLSLQVYLASMAFRCN